MKPIFYTISKILFIYLFLSLTLYANASTSPNEQQQGKVVRGVVLEETNEPLIGASVYVKGTTTGTTTDIDGKYELQVNSEDAILVFSFLGKITEERSVRGQSMIDVVMTDDVTALSEVVYTGYMTQKKADLTGSLAMATASDIQKNPSANVMKSLQGKLPGVYINTNGGDPLEDVTVQIRGLSSLSGGIKPLIVLDGMPTESLNLRDINAGDIESIQVLKDAASASIYGARASGGVILVQTKKGEAGKTKIEYNGSVSFNKVIDRPKVMNAEQYGRAIFQVQAYDDYVFGKAMALPNYFEYDWSRNENGFAVLNSVRRAEWLNADQTLRVADTNWMDEIYQTAMMTNHHLTISKGSDKSKSLFSLGYYDNEGTQIHTFFRQYSARVNTEYNLLNNRLKIGENISLSYLKFKGGNETFLSMVAPPVVPVHDVDGGWAGDLLIGDYQNPVRILTMSKDNHDNFMKVIGNVYADLNIWKGLSARTQYGIDYGSYYNRIIDGKWDETGGRNSNGENYVKSYQSHRFNYVWTNTLSYNLNTGKHSVDAVVGSEVTKYVEEGFSARREGLYLEDRDFAHIGVATNTAKTQLASSADEFTYFSLFGKVNYSFDAKYLLSATLRRDGSSLFGANNRYGTFPAFSAGWRINNESFMKDIHVISDLKLRASWGQNGSVQGLPRGYTKTPFTTDYDGTAYPISGNETGALWSGYRRTWLGNADLKWETTEQTDLAVDFGFLNQRINGSLGYYFKKTTDLLVQTPYIAAMGEGGEPWYNGAAMNNKGVEFSISYSNDPKEAFQYTITANVGTYKTEIIDVPENVINKYPGDGVYDLVLGRTPNIIYGMVADGIFRTQEEVDNHAEQTGKGIGRLRYKDLDGNGKIDDYDRTYIGITDPDFFGGLTVDLKYRDFDMNLFFQGVYGNQVYNNWKERSDLWTIGNLSGANHEDRILRAWYFDNQNSDIPAMSSFAANEEVKTSSYFVEDGSYLKLRNIEFGYTIPAKLTKKALIERLRLYVSARNLFTLKKAGYSSFDPENPNHKYLTPFSMTFGLNLTF